MRVEPGRLGLSTLLLAVAAVQGLLVTYGGGGTHFTSIWWAFLVALVAAVASVRMLLRAQDPDSAPWVLLGPALGGTWLLVVHLDAVAPEMSLAPTLVWCTALTLVPVIRLLFLLERIWPLFLALTAAPALHLLAEAIPMLGSVRAQVDGVVDLNVLADRLLVVLIVAVAAAGSTELRGEVSVRRRWAFFLGALGLSAAAAVLVQQALSSRFAVVVSVPILVLLVLSFRDRWRWLTVPGTMLGVYVLGALVPELAWVGPSVGEEAGFGTTQFADAGRARSDLWSAAIALLARDPLTGTGLASFGVLYPQFRTDADSTTGALVHNDYLQLALEAGFPALVGLVMVAGTTAVAAWRLVRRPPSRSTGSQQRPFVMASLLILAMLFLHAFINFPFYDPVLLNLTVAAFVVLCSAAWSRTSSPEADTNAAMAGGGGLASLVALMLSLFWVRAGVYVVALVVLAGRAPFPGVGPVQFDGEQRLRWAERLDATGLAFGMPAYVQAATFAELVRQDVLEPDPQTVSFVRTRFEDAIASSPWIDEHYVQYSRFLRERGEPLSVRLAPLEEALRRDPFSPRAWLAYAYNLQLEGAFDARAGEIGATWLPRCVYAVRVDWRAAFDMLRLLPMEVKAAHSEETGNCAAWLLFFGAPLPALPASVTIPERPH